MFTLISIVEGFCYSLLWADVTDDDSRFLIHAYFPLLLYGYCAALFLLDFLRFASDEGSSQAQLGKLLQVVCVLLFGCF